MIKKRIVIASVLKPITDPRAFYKLALSLRETNKYSLNIIGFCSKKKPFVNDIQFTTIFCRSRTHPSRLLAPFRFLQEILRCRPQLVIITTYELLPMALVGQFLLRYRLIYDVQENYSQNVLLNQTSSRLIRNMAAWLIRVIEKASHPFIAHYFFAEQVYSSQFPYIDKFTVLENKFQGEFIPKGDADTKQTTFIISGTITPVYGVEKAINWFVSLQQHFPELTLTILGHVPLQSFQKQLEKLVENHPPITLNLSSSPIPHSAILEGLREAEIVLMPYDTIDSISHKIPSKLYESLALKKPVLISKNPLWQKMIAVYPAGLCVDFENTTDAVAVYNKLQSLHLYQVDPGIELRWEGEKQRLIQAVARVVG